MPGSEDLGLLTFEFLQDFLAFDGYFVVSVSVVIRVKEFDKTFVFQIGYSF